MKVMSLIRLSLCLVASTIATLIVFNEIQLPDKSLLVASRYSEVIKGRYMTVENNSYSGFNFFSIDKDSIKLKDKVPGTANCYLDQLSSFHRKCTLRKTDYLKIDNALSDDMYYIVSDVSNTTHDESKFKLQLASIDSSTLKLLGAKPDKEIVVNQNLKNLKKDSIVKIEADGSISVAQNPTYSGKYYYNDEHKSYYEVKIQDIGNEINDREASVLDKNNGKSYGLSYFSSEELLFVTLTVVAPYILMVAALLQVILYSASTEVMKYAIFVIASEFIASNPFEFLNMPHSISIFLYAGSALATWVFLFKATLEEFY